MVQIIDTECLTRPVASEMKRRHLRICGVRLAGFDDSVFISDKKYRGPKMVPILILRKWVCNGIESRNWKAVDEWLLLLFSDYSQLKKEQR